MFIKYAWLSGAPVASVLDDIAKLACGSTIPALSAACDMLNTVVLASSTESNWEQVDTAGTTNRVLRSPNVDGTYKYAYFYLNGSNKLAFRACENWNSVSHTSVNEAFYKGGAFAEPVGNTTIPQTGNVTTAAGILYVYATARNFFIDGVQVTEFTKSSNALGSAYPCHAIWNPGACSVFNANYLGIVSNPGAAAGFGVCRYRNVAGADYTLANTSAYSTKVTCEPTLMLPVQSQQLRTTAEISFIQSVPVMARCLVNAADTTVGKVNLGKIFDLQASGAGGITMAVYDEITLNGITHICIANNSSFRFYLPKV